MHAGASRCLVVAASFIAAVLSLTSAPALASPKMPTSAMMAPINDIVAAVNANNLAMTKKFYTSSPIIIDEFAPYRWSGPNAVATWFANFGAFQTMAKITQGHVTVADPSYWDVSKDRTEIIVPATFTFVVGGKPAADSALWTFVLVNSGGSWKAESSTWVRTQLTM